MMTCSPIRAEKSKSAYHATAAANGWHMLRVRGFAFVSRLTVLFLFLSCLLHCPIVLVVVVFSLYPILIPSLSSRYTSIGSAGHQLPDSRAPVRGRRFGADRFGNRVVITVVIVTIVVIVAIVCLVFAASPLPPPFNIGLQKGSLLWFPNVPPLMGPAGLSRWASWSCLPSPIGPRWAFSYDPLASHSGFRRVSLGLLASPCVVPRGSPCRFQTSLHMWGLCGARYVFSRGPQSSSIGITPMVSEFSPVVPEKGGLLKLRSVTT